MDFLGMRKVYGLSAIERLIFWLKSGKKPRAHTNSSSIPGQNDQSLNYELTRCKKKTSRSWLGAKWIRSWSSIKTSFDTDAQAWLSTKAMKVKGVEWFGAKKAKFDNEKRKNGWNPDSVKRQAKYWFDISPNYGLMWYKKSYVLTCWKKRLCFSSV